MEWTGVGDRSRNSAHEKPFKVFAFGLKMS
jgi:hypothetical protein